MNNFLQLQVIHKINTFKNLVAQQKTIDNTENEMIFSSPSVLIILEGKSGVLKTFFFARIFEPIVSWVVTLLQCAGSAAENK